MNADPSSIVINCVGISIWILLWYNCDLFSKTESVPSLQYMFFALIAVLVLNTYNSDSSEGTYDEEVRKLQNVETHAKTLCTLVITVSLCTRMMKDSLGGKHVISTFYYLMILATMSTSIVLFDYSIPKDASKVRQLRKIESIFINFATVFTVMSVIFVSFHMIEKN